MAHYLLAQKKEHDTDPARYYAWMDEGRPHYSTKTHAARFNESMAGQVKSHLAQLGFDEPEIVPDS